MLAKWSSYLIVISQLLIYSRLDLVMDMDKNDLKCVLCGNELTFKYKSMEEWKISGYICGICYDKKLSEFYISPDRKDVVKR
jgi:NAD-dependent oxidoreductase involved in siderophore biosynthesis